MISKMAQRVKCLLQCKRLGFDPWFRKIPWRKKWQPTPVFLPGKFCGQRSLVGYGSWGCKELDMTERTQHTLSKQRQYQLESRGTKLGTKSAYHIYWLFII